MIDAYHDGKITVNGETYHNDLKVIRDRVISDWWRKQSHLLKAEDIKDILSTQPEILVVGIGYAKGMRVEKDLESRLKNENIKLIAQDTGTAVKTFNRFHTEGKSVAGAFHLTC